MAVLGNLTQSKRIAGPGQIFLVSYPLGTCSGGTCTLTAGSPGVMTLVTAPTIGSVNLGSTLVATGVTGSVVISALASGVLNAPGSTYTLTGGSTILEASAEAFTTTGTPGYYGGTDALRVTNVKQQFYSDAATDADRLIIPSAYSEIDATGIEVRIHQNSVDYDPNMGGKYKVQNAPSECTVTWSYKDVDANKIIDAFSALTGDTFTTVASTGVAGRKTVVLGRQSAPLLCALLVRYPSEFTSAGSVAEYRNIYIPYATVTPDWTIKIDKKSAATVKMVANAICDYTLQGTQAMPPIALTDDTNTNANAKSNDEVKTGERRICDDWFPTSAVFGQKVECNHRSRNGYTNACFYNCVQ